MCVCVCVCVCVWLNVSIRILKFGTNIEYDLLHCVRENQHPQEYHSLYLYNFSFSPLKYFATDFSASMRTSLQTLYTYRGFEVYCIQANNDAGIHFAFFLFIFFFFFIFIFFPSHSNVMHWEICVKDSLGTTAPKNLKFGKCNV